jgi:hypothetical protein
MFAPAKICISLPCLFLSIVLTIID